MSSSLPSTVCISVTAVSVDTSVGAADASIRDSSQAELASETMSESNTRAMLEPRWGSGARTLKKFSFRQISGASRVVTEDRGVLQGI